MARGIEHREADSVVKAYEIGKKPNWGIFAGSELMVAYDGGEMEGGADMLQTYLEVLESQGSATVFTLKTYYADTTKITNKTPNSGSTTFMLSQNAKTIQDEKTGLTIIDRTQYSKAGAPSQDPALLARIERLEKVNETLQNQLHQQQIKALEDKMNTAISGLSNQPSGWGKLFDTIAERPEIIPDAIGKLSDMFFGAYSRVKGQPQQPNFVHNAPIAGSNQIIDEPIKQDPQMSGTQNTTTTDPDQLTEEQVTACHDQQEECSDNLEDKLGIENYTGYLVYLNSMNDKQLSAWSQQEQKMQIIRTRLTDEQLTKLVSEVSEMSDIKLKLLLGYLD